MGLPELASGPFSRTRGEQSAARLFAQATRCLGLVLVAGTVVLAHAAPPSGDVKPGQGRGGGGEHRISGLIPVDGRALYLECIGSGSPTVVFISGGFEAGWIWKYALYSTDPVLESPTDEFSAGRGDAQQLGRAVFPTIGEQARVCNYDRPNTTLGSNVKDERNGRISTPVPQPHSAMQDVKDLHTLLKTARVPGPFVLVAHSYGGLIAELYARTYPKEVVGRVLVDVTTVFLEKTLTPEDLKRLDESVMAVNPASPDGERLMILDAMTWIESAPAPPRVPVFLLSSDKPGDSKPETLQLFQRIRQAHDLLAEQLCAKHMKRTNSGHHIFAEQPQLVNDAIREVVEAARKACSTIPCEGVRPNVDPSVAQRVCG